MRSITSLHTSRSGFTILIALGTIGILLIIVTSLASIYLNEMKLSRIQYDTIFAYAQADGAFEYAMLKIRNHPDGFQDAMSSVDADSALFSGSTMRTMNTKIQYTIGSQSRDQIFTLSGGSHLILPLFIGTGVALPGSITSLDPRYSDARQKIASLQIQGDGTPLDTLSWSIIALSGSENTSIAGTGVIDQNTTLGIMRIQSVDCYDTDGNQGPSTAVDPLGNCTGIYADALGGESVAYTYDTALLVRDFLRNTGYRNPYILLYNTGNPALSLHVTTDTPFTLPILRVNTEARKGNSVQSIEYREDTSKYYDALRYGIYSE